MTSQINQEAEATAELKALVMYCARLAAQFKTSYRLGELEGFFKRLRNEKKVQTWGTQLERDYVQLVERSPHLWKSLNLDQEKNIYNLWHLFGFSASEQRNAAYPYELAALCLSSWIEKLYYGYEISPEDLLTRKNEIVERRGRLRNEIGNPRVSITFADPFDSMVEDLSNELSTYAILFSLSA